MPVWGKLLLSVDCRLSEWTSWSSCTKTCSGGTQKRSRSVLKPEQHGGQACPKLQETKGCNTKDCPGTFNRHKSTQIMIYISCSVDCRLSEWTSWSLCTKTCNGGSRMRKKTVLRPKQNGGQACRKVQQTYGCNTNKCPGNQLTSRPMDSNFQLPWQLYT